MHYRVPLVRKVRGGIRNEVEQMRRGKSLQAGEDTVPRTGKCDDSTLAKWSKGNNQK